MGKSMANPGPRYMSTEGTGQGSYNAAETLRGILAKQLDPRTALAQMLAINRAQFGSTQAGIGPNTKGALDAEFMQQQPEMERQIYGRSSFLGDRESPNSYSAKPTSAGNAGRQAGFYQFDNGGVEPGAPSSHSQLAKALQRKRDMQRNRMFEDQQRDQGLRMGEAEIRALNRDTGSDDLDRQLKQLEIDQLGRQGANYEEDRRREMLLRILGSIG